MGWVGHAPHGSGDTQHIARLFQYPVPCNNIRCKGNIQGGAFRGCTGQARISAHTWKQSALAALPFLFGPATLGLPFLWRPARFAVQRCPTSAALPTQNGFLILACFAGPVVWGYQVFALHLILYQVFYLCQYIFCGFYKYFP